MSEKAEYGSTLQNTICKVQPYARRCRGTRPTKAQPYATFGPIWAKRCIVHHSRNAVGKIGAQNRPCLVILRRTRIISNLVQQCARLYDKAMRTCSVFFFTGLLIISYLYKCVILVVCKFEVSGKCYMNSWSIMYLPFLVSKTHLISILSTRKTDLGDHVVPT